MPFKFSVPNLLHAFRLITFPRPSITRCGAVCVADFIPRLFLQYSCVPRICLLCQAGSSFHLFSLGALVVDPPDDQVRGCDDDEGRHEANHDANFVSGPRAGVIRGCGCLRIGHCEDWRITVVMTRADQ